MLLRSVVNLAHRLRDRLVLGVDAGDTRVITVLRTLPFAVDAVVVFPAGNHAESTVPVGGVRVELHTRLGRALDAAHFRCEREEHGVLVVHWDPAASNDLVAEHT